MKKLLLPALWVIVFIGGLPQLSETVYTPALPEIASAFHVFPAIIEYTLTIYLLGFAVGTLFWGKISDRFGRKPCVIAGLLVFMVGCAGCYFSSDITSFMISRFIQALGGSIGSVLGQAICRDAFHGPALGKAYSVIGSSLALFPAVGPVIGGLIAEYFGWSFIFLFLIAFAIFLTAIVNLRLPETHLKENRQTAPIKTVMLSLLNDKKVIGFGLIVAACNGINFSYFAEAPFYLIQLLGLSASQYGFSLVPIAMSIMLGGFFSKKLHDKHESQTIMRYGLGIISLGTALLTSIVLINTVFPISKSFLIAATVVSQMVTMFGVCMTTSNALALALVNYKWCIGTASSLFGFFYYCFISLFTWGMGALHNGTLLPMPLYFLMISLLMIIMRKKLIG